MHNKFLPQLNSSNIEQQVSPDLTINSRAFLLQSRFLELADRFTLYGFGNGPIQAVNNLLLLWLTSPIETLSDGNQPPQMHEGLLLADFLDELLEAHLPQSGEGLTNA